MKIILFANTDWYLYNFRLSLAHRLKEKGYEVILLSPSGPYVRSLQSLGFRCINLPLARRSINPLVEGLTLLRLCSVYLRERPDIVHHFTIKCVLYGSFVSRLAHVKSVVNSVTGLGYVFLGEGVIKTILRSVVILLYRVMLKETKVIFQNPDDQKFFLEEGLVKDGDSLVIRGSGVDVDRFSIKQEHEDLNAPVVVFPGRLLWDKGVGEFVSAASVFRSEGGNARFVLVGDCDEDNPSSIPVRQIQEWVKNDGIEWWGWQEDMSQVFAQAQLVCLPSYREGLPKALIEAASCGRAIVATDLPGCREVVRPGVNGLLIPPRDIRALANAIGELLRDPDQRIRMGLAGRQIVLHEFSDARIVSETLDAYRTL